MKRFRITLVALVLILGCGLLTVPRMVGAEDNQTEQTEAEKKAAEAAKEAAQKAAEAEKEAAQKATELAREEAKKLEEQRIEADKKRHEELKKAEEAAREAAKQESEQEKKDHETEREAFKQACEQRRESFKNRMETVIDAVANRTDKLDTLLERLKGFVTQQGLIVPNYNALLTEAATKAELLHKVAVAAKESADDLDCSDKETAKDSLAGSSDAIRQQVNTVEAYKSAVKNLVSAVKTAAKEAENAQ